jgi:hypothetical protein
MRQKRRELSERAKAPDDHDFRAKNGLLAPDNPIHFGARQPHLRGANSLRMAIFTPARRTEDAGLKTPALRLNPKAPQNFVSAATLSME